MSTVRRSLAYSALDSYVALVLQIVSTVVVARILTPEQVGIFAVAAVFAALASTFRDFGVGEYLIQEKNLTPEVLRAALTVNIGVSWIMALLLLVLAPFAADFYRTAGVADVMRVQAVNFVLIPFGAVTMAWFRREMNFKPIFLAGLVANCVSFAVVLALALNGFGYMSLAWSSLAGVVATVMTSLALRPKGFPRRPGWRGVAKVFHFGKFASGVYIFGQLGKGAPEMIVGKAAGMADVGMFSRAQGLVEIFHRLVLRAVLPVCLPFFAKGVRETGSPKAGLLLSISYVTAVGWPFLAFIALAAFAAVRLIYGTQWMAAVPLAKLLCAAAAVELVYVASKEALLASGLVKPSSVLQIGIQLLRVAGLLAVVPWGLEGAAWGLLVAAVLGTWLSHHFLARHLGLRLREVSGALASSALLTLLSTAPLAAYTAWHPLDESNYLPVAGAAGVAAVLLWVLGLRMTRHPLWPELVGGAQAVLKRLR